ncbi:hypothetical protein [Mycobacterium sp.]|uniref:hypothetical protein n=1 Tax=Mycobacterium sp. TaxID=1785 RepID=UPI003C70EB11
MFDDPASLAKVFALANKVVRPLLRSPLHPTLSSRLMLLSYTGGKTGKEYTLAIGYFPWDDGDILAFSSANWPKTLGSARDVRVLIKGRWLAAQPTVIRQVEQKADVLGEFARRNGPRAAKGLMLGLPGDRQPDRQESLAAAANTTIVRFTLTNPS